jgi:hypothetical protein
VNHGLCHHNSRIEHALHKAVSLLEVHRRRARVARARSKVTPTCDLDFGVGERSRLHCESGEGALLGERPPSFTGEADFDDAISYLMGGHRQQNISNVGLRHSS